MAIEQIILDNPQAYRIHQAVIFSPEEIEFSDEVRAICEKNSCRGYGSCWACPPAVGSVESCREKCLQYDHALMFTTATKIEGKYNIQGWHNARKAHEDITDAVVREFRTEHPDALTLSTEGCLVCAKCAYPEPCRFPDRMYPAVESFGIHVMKTAPKVGVRYNNGEGVVTYFSLILF